MRWWWFYPGGQARGPYFIVVCRSADRVSAARAMGCSAASPCLHELTSPMLIRAADGAEADKRYTVEVPDLPMSGDRYRQSAYR